MKDFAGKSGTVATVVQRFFATVRVADSIPGRNKFLFSVAYRYLLRSGSLRLRNHDPGEISSVKQSILKKLSVSIIHINDEAYSFLMHSIQLHW